MKEISIHGRGGQGSLVLAQLMAIAALEDGKYGQAFPFLGGGGERRGKPIIAFCRLSNRPIRLRSRVNEPDYVIVQDSTILNELYIARGLKDDGLIIVNSDRSIEKLGFKGSFQVINFSADNIARQILGRPLMNTALLGAFAAVTQELSLDASIKAVRSKFSGQLGEKNVQIVRESYNRLRKEEG